MGIRNYETPTVSFILAIMLKYNITPQQWYKLIVA